jgi:hypothetical protein
MNTFVEVPQPDIPHKPLPNLVDSTRVRASTSHAAAFFITAARTLTSAGRRKNAVFDLADPPGRAKRYTTERVARRPRKHRDHADDQANEDEKPRDDAP